MHNVYVYIEEQFCKKKKIPLKPIQSHGREGKKVSC